MSDNSPSGIMETRALEIYQEVLSERNLSERATKLVSDVESLREKVGLLQENIVSLPIMLASSCAVVLIHRELKRHANQRLDLIQSLVSHQQDSKECVVQFEVCEPWTASSLVLTFLGSGGTS